MIDEGKFIKFFCVMDGFCKNFASECEKKLPFGGQGILSLQLQGAVELW